MDAQLQHHAISANKNNKKWKKWFDEDEPPTITTVVNVVTVSTPKYSCCHSKIHRIQYLWKRTAKITYGPESGLLRRMVTMMYSTCTSLKMNQSSTQNAWKYV
jgi:hypothetical protein